MASNHSNSKRKRGGEQEKRQGMVAAVVALVQLLQMPFLAGGIVLHALGVATALYGGATLDVPALVLTQLVITSTQLMTHASNEYFDLDTDRQNPTPTLWAGGSRVLPEGRLAPKTALWLAALFAAIAAITDMIFALLLGEAQPLGAGVLESTTFLELTFDLSPYP